VYSSPDKFAEMLRRVVKADKLPRYQMTSTTTQDGSPGVHFVDREIAIFTAEQRRNEQGQARMAKIAAEDARVALVDPGRNLGRFSKYPRLSCHQGPVRRRAARLSEPAGVLDPGFSGSQPLATPLADIS
jgi:hypothetical protein